MNEPLILSAAEFREALAAKCIESRREVSIASAFVTSQAVEWLSGHIPEGCAVRIVARWRKHDLVVGASDVNAYYVAKACGYRFLVDLSLHTKAYIFDMESVFIGSANLTRKGLWLGCEGNSEHVSLFSPRVDDLAKLERVFSQAKELDDDTVRSIEAELESGPASSSDWPDELQEMLRGDTYGVWVSDFPADPPLSASGSGRMECAEIGGPGGGSSEVARGLCAQRSQFVSSKSWQWLESKLEAHGALRFGSISALLHDDLLDSPAPYRKDVKGLVAVLLDWVEFALPDRVEVMRHRHTKSIQLK